jgi:hypothetical protein
MPFILNSDSFISVQHQHPAKKYCVLQLLVIAKVVPNAPTFVTLMMEAKRYSATSVLTRITRHHITEDTILHSHRPENLKSYIALTGWTQYRRRNVSPVKYELEFYIPAEDILHSHRRDNLKAG